MADSMTRLLAILQQRRVPYKRAGEDHHISRARAGWIGLHCPWCGGNSYHFGVNVYTGQANCWRCGRKPAVEAIAKLCRIPFAEANDLFANARFARPLERPLQRIVKPKGVLDEMLPVHQAYLRRRGFDPNAISRLWGVRSIGMASELAWRLYIPIYDRLGYEVSWTTRSIKPGTGQRYISASSEQEEVPHKDLLYGAHLARRAVVVVEGPTDAWSIGPGAVATCGLSVSTAQINELVTYPIRVICFDNEERAQARAEKLGRLLANCDGQTHQVVLETGADPAEADLDEIDELRAAYLDF